MTASVFGLRKIPVGFHFADLLGVPGAMRRRRQQPLVAVPWTEERVVDSMLTKAAGDQQSDALFTALDELL